MTEEVVRVGVVGDDRSSAAETLAGEGLDPVEATPDTVLDADPDVVVAVGEAPLLAVARRRPSSPLLPVEAGSGFRSVPLSGFEAAVGHLVAGEWQTDTHPILTVDDGTNESLAVMDTMLVTAEPARISEFTVTAGSDRVAQFRADGVVAAAPAGTRGYADSAGAPVVPPGMDALAVVPVAPFATRCDHWVVPAEDLTITVERDSATVEVLADDRTVGRASKDVPVEIRGDGAIETVRLPAGRSPFARQGAELEKL